MFIKSEKYHSLSFKYGLTILISLLLLSLFSSAEAQSLSKLLKKGNTFYKDQNYSDAEAQYKKALAKDSTSSIGQFNLGNALYEQKRYDNALQQYATHAQAEDLSKTERAETDYNIGNVHMEKKDWEKAIDAYKKSLIANPQDEEARYNLAYAQAMLQENQNGEGENDNQNQDQDQDQDQDQNNQNKDQENQDQDGEDQQNQDQDQDKNDEEQSQNQPENQDEQKPEEEEQNPQPQPGQMDQQRAEQLLNAAAQQERKIRENKDKKEKGVRAYRGKQW